MVTKSTQKTFGGRKTHKNTKDKNKEKVFYKLGLVGPLVKFGPLVAFGPSFKMLGPSLWLISLGLPCVGFNLTIDLLKHLLHLIISPWIWAAITDHPTSSVYAHN